MARKIVLVNQRKLMKIYRISPSALLSTISVFYASLSVLYGQDFSCKNHLDSIVQGSQMDCLQGVYQVTNDNNPEFENYHITYKYKYLIIYLKKQGGSLDEFNLGYHGFVNQDDVTLGLTICDLQSDGDTYVSVAKDDIINDIYANTYYQNEDFQCESEFVEYFTRQLMFKEKIPLLPFRVYKHIKDKSLADQRDYLTEFNIPSLLNKAKIEVNKTYFYASPDESTRRRTFVVKGDELIVDTVTENWVKAAYEGNTTIIGWLKRTDLKISD